jgi:hypothetical protein
MAEIVGSLFGITPDLYERQLRAQDEERAIKMANLAPGARGAAMIQSGAGTLSRGIGGLLGAEDPQLKLIAARQSIMNQLDQTNPESMLKGAQTLAQMGDQQGAFALADYARKAESEIAQAKQRMAQATRERQQAIPPDILKAQTEATLKAKIRELSGYEQTPEIANATAMLTDQLNALTRTKETAPNIKTVGVAVGTKKPVFLDVNSDQQFTYEIDADGKQVRKPYVGQVDRATSTSTVNLPPQENAFESGLGTGQSKMILENKSAALDAASILETNQVAKNLLKSGVITGTGANFFVGLNNALQQAGLDFGYADAAANSQAYVAAMGANVGRLIKQFGAGTGLSNADRDYAEKIAGGQITLTESALRKIIDINDRAANRVIDLHNKNVKDIKTNIPLTVEKPVTTQTPKSAVEQIPTQQGASMAPVYARNPQTNQRIMSMDGGKTWQPAR